ncbi:MAG: PIN domain-containing protein [Solirubrobacterales bacterium]|nr:PIN domain-containing protein [Solirubrobacterales bacterium]
MSVTVDTNVLVYASNESDPAHAPARALVERLAAGPDLLYLFWPCLLGYVRLVTHPAILPRPLGAADALANVAALLDPAHVRTPGEADGFLDVYRQTADPNTRGNAVPDAHLAALMRQHGVRTIYTRDRDFLRFAELDVRDPFV